MKVFLTIFVITGFISVAVFGFSGMHIDMQNHDGGCIAATAQGVGCPKQINPTDYFTFHLDAFKSFSIATIGSTVAPLVLILFLLFISAAFGILLSYVLFLFACHQRKQPALFYLSSQRGLIRWLALHENSPTIQ